MADILLGNVKGPQGNTGATGSQGPQGEAATITVGTVSTTAYGNTASVTNSGTEQDAVLDFVIPQGKPGEQTTRMGALTLDTITAQSADFPIPAVGETGSTVFGKIIKFFNSTISALNSKLNISDVVNNLTSTSTTQPLSAAQGKALNDALATKEAKISEAAVSDGSGVGGTTYITSFGYRWIYKFGPVVCVSVNLTTGSAIPAWTQFALVQSAYRTNRGMGRLNFAAYNLNNGAVYPINLNPSTGAIETDSVAIPSGTTVRFYLTYII